MQRWGYYLLRSIQLFVLLSVKKALGFFVYGFDVLELSEKKHKSFKLILS